METTLKKTFEIITSSEEFKKFRNEHPDAELCTCFFVIDFFGNDNKKSLDYKLGEKVFSFSINELDKIKMYEDKLVKVENKEFPQLEAINPDVKVDLEEITEMAKAKALEKGISSKFSKIIAVLQKYNHNGNDIQAWNLTCMLEGLIILHMMIDSETGEIIKFERKSMMDLIKKK